MMVEEFGWTPADCMALTIRERTYWIRYINYKRQLERYHKMAAPPSQQQQQRR